MNPEYYYLSAYRLSDNQLTFLRIYHKHHDLIVWLLIEYGFEISKYPEEDFNKIYYRSDKKTKTKDYQIYSFDQYTRTELLEKTLKEAYNN